MCTKHDVRFAQKVEGKEQLLITKLDNLLKQVGKHKAKVISQKVKVEPFFSTLNESMHVMKEFTTSLSILPFWIWLSKNFYMKKCKGLFNLL
jgi:hypothetical protein